MTQPRPAVGAPTAWAFPQPASHRLDTGLSVLAYDVPGQYVASVRLVVPCRPKKPWTCCARRRKPARAGACMHRSARRWAAWS